MNEQLKANLLTQGGFTMVPNKVLNGLLFHGLNGCEVAAVLLLSRLTYGFQQLDSPLSKGHIESYTNHHVSSIRNAVRELRERNIIVQTAQPRDGYAAKYKINEDVNQWSANK